MQEVAWHMSQALSMEISNLMAQAVRAMVNGNLNRAFHITRSIKFRFVQELKSDERTELKELEEIIAKNLSSYNDLQNKGFNKPDDESNKTAEEVWLKFEDYNEMIMDLLNKYGYLMKKKADSSGLGIKIIKS